jgi:pimeloyl-ACP methyl ester carboxylesterase
MTGSRKPRVVVTIHGIRTHGKWQKEITPYLARHGLIPYHIDFGFFRAIFFFFKWTRERQVKAVRDELRSLVAHLDSPRIGIIAHSFGTHLAMEALVRENGGLLYDRIVLTGSIVPRDFDWNSALEKKWVMALRNERATDDWVVSLAAFASRRLSWITRLKAGDSGRQSFTQDSPTLLDNYVVGPHSETHNPLKYEQWARFIAYPNLPDDVLEKVTIELQQLRQHAASILKVISDRLRTNLFAPIDGALRIVHGATDNMNYAPELDIQIEAGHGATGVAFVTGNPCLVLKTATGWSGSTLPGKELAKVHPSLQWVLSLPVKSKERGLVVGVVTVDGLDNIPTILQDSASVECQAAMLALHGSMLGRFQPYLEAAFRGERPPTIER